jgi:asparagine synthase (glutamine-hydrolysing)
LLRRLARRLLPADVADAPKRGFEIPLQRWARYDLHDMIADLCLDPNGIIATTMDLRAVRDLVERRWRLDDERWARRVWTLLMLSLWDRTCKPQAA